MVAHEVRRGAVAASAEPAVEITLEGVAPRPEATDVDVGDEALDEEVHVVRVERQRVSHGQLADRLDGLEPLQSQGEVRRVGHAATVRPVGVGVIGVAPGRPDVSNRSRHQRRRIARMDR